MGIGRAGDRPPVGPSEGNHMRLIRPLGLFALTAGLAALLGTVSVEAAQLTKQEKKELRLKKKQEAAPAAKVESAPAKPVTIQVGPVGPKDAAVLSRLIDEQIAKKLADAKIAPSPLASDEEFLRRVYLDLTGVIPASDNARAFLDSTDLKKREKLIDEL